jgi:two-component system cell cycle sensor histidine kinase/response regulator CckA
MVPESGPRGVTVLVVDDETSVLALARTMLWRAGFDVLEASDPTEALQLSAAHTAPIQLLLTDVLMPDMNGFDLAEKVKTQRPDIKVLYMSGFTDTVLLESTGRSLTGLPLIRKPFTAHRLVSTISDLLANHSAALESGLDDQGATA